MELVNIHWRRKVFRWKKVKDMKAATKRYDRLALALSNIETTNASSSSLRLSHFGINGSVRKPRQSRRNELLEWLWRGRNSHSSCR